MSVIRRTLLRIVRAAQQISRADLARRWGANRSTVTEIVKPLIASEVLREAASEKMVAGRRDRPAIRLSLRSERSLFIGVNIGALGTQVGAATRMASCSMKNHSIQIPIRTRR